MALGRDEMVLVGRLVEAVERLAIANEQLIRLAKEEREEILPGPPTCPTCGMENPDIKVEGGSGPMADFVLLATCEHCKNRFFAITNGWQSSNDIEQLIGKGGHD